MLTSEQRAEIENALRWLQPHMMAYRILTDMLSRESAAPGEGPEQTVWAVYNGVCLHDIYQSESAARACAKEMQKRHDLSGSLAAFHVEPRILATAPTMSEAAEQRFAQDFARIGEQFMNMCIDLGCPNDTNILDWARERIDRAASTGCDHG